MGPRRVPSKDVLHSNCEWRILRRGDRDMARKKTGKRGSAIIVLMVVAAIAGSPSTAAAASATPQPLVSVAVPAPVLALDRASWAEASWAEE